MNNSYYFKTVFEDYNIDIPILAEKLPVIIDSIPKQYSTGNTLISMVNLALKSLKGSLKIKVWPNCMGYYSNNSSPEADKDDLLLLEKETARMYKKYFEDDLKKAENLIESLKESINTISYYIDS